MLPGDLHVYTLSESELLTKLPTVFLVTHLNGLIGILNLKYPNQNTSQSSPFQ